MSNYKIGDKVWVECEVVELHENLIKVTGRGDNYWFWAGRGQCRPVEPEAVEACTKTANDQLRQSLMDYPFGEPSNCPEIPDSSSEPLLLGDAVELQSNNVWRGTKGILTNWCSVKKAFWFESLDPSRKAISGWMKEQWDDEEAGICRLVKIDHPNDSPKPDSSSEPMREAFEDWMAPNYDWNQGYFGRNENRYFDSSVEMAWQAFQAGSKYQPSPLAPSPCMDGVNVDQFVDGVMEARGRASDPINPSHYKQGGIECIEAIKAATGEGFIGYVWGNVLKYLWRWPKKGGVDDLKKARWYLDRLIKEVGE